MAQVTDSIMRSAAELKAAFDGAACEIADRLAKSVKDPGSSDHWYAVKAYLQEQMGGQNAPLLR